MIIKTIIKIIKMYIVLLMKKVYAPFVLMVLFTACMGGGEKQEKSEPVWENNIYSRIGIAPVGGGFAMEDYWVWGSSVVRGDDSLYHMYVSRWPKNLPFHPGWMVASEIVHAVSENPEGPYQFSDVALPARGPEYWDGRSTHNPRILRHKDQIGRASCRERV